jgi:hypothetical protein
MLVKALFGGALMTAVYAGDGAAQTPSPQQQLAAPGSR